MGKYILSLILSIIAAGLFTGYKLFEKKESLMRNEIKNLKSEQIKLSKLKQKYIQLMEFRKKFNIKPIKKTEAEKRFLSLLNSLQKKYRNYDIKIANISYGNKVINFEISITIPYKSKKDIEKLFNEILNNHTFYIPSIEKFSYHTEKTGSILEVYIKVFIPYVEP